MIKLNNKNNYNLVDMINKAQYNSEMIKDSLFYGMITTFLLTIFSLIVGSTFIGITHEELIKLLFYSLGTSSIFTATTIVGINIKKRNNTMKERKRLNKVVNELDNNQELLFSNEIIKSDIITLDESAELNISNKNIKHLRKVTSVIVMSEKVRWCAIKQVTEKYILNDEKKENNNLYLLDMYECNNILDEYMDDTKPKCKVLNFRVK